MNNKTLNFDTCKKKLAQRVGASCEKVKVEKTAVIVTTLRDHQQRVKTGRGTGKKELQKTTVLKRTVISEKHAMIFRDTPPVLNSTFCFLDKRKSMSPLSAWRNVTDKNATKKIIANAEARRRLRVVGYVLEKH